MNEQPICPHCKQPEVSADAAVRWDVEAQAWSITNVFDKDRRCENFDCEYAGCEITPEWVAVVKAANPALVEAARNAEALNEEAGQ